MRAFMVTSRGAGVVADVDPPTAGPGQVVVDIARAGICGTDVMLFNADDAQIRERRSAYPLRPGHEWCGTVSLVGQGVDRAWLGRRVTGDTMLGCGHCDLCAEGAHHLCADRYEIGVRGGWPGALAEQLSIPASALLELPDTVTNAMGAMVEPGGNAYRAVAAAQVGAASRLLVLGPGTIGLLCVMFGCANGAEVHVVGRNRRSLDLARRLGATGAWTADGLPPLVWDSVIDATDAVSMPAFAAATVKPGGRVVYIGIPSEPSTMDARTLVRRDLTAVGILGGSAGLQPTIKAYSEGRVDPSLLVAETVPLSCLPQLMAGGRDRAVDARPKIQVDPTADDQSANSLPK